MPPKQKTIVWWMAGFAAAAFALFCLPNLAASKNMSMIQMFAPDEAAPLPYVLRMIAPSASLDKALRGFIFYDYYYYGFPYFALSALLLLPLQALGKLADYSLMMLILRQFVSVLPMLAALLLLVYMQDGFRTYRSPLLFAFLLCIPAVVNNNLWWHPDSLTFLLVVLTIFFLWRDQLRFGRNFILAAVTCGVATATKLMGVYFFLAVGLTLLLGLVLKKNSWKKLALMGLAFIAVMAVAYVAANPFLLSHWARTAYVNIEIKQSDLLSQGYGVVYAKGLAAAWPTMHDNFGEWVFLVTALGVAVWAAWRDRSKRLLHGLILAWFIPVTFAVLVLTHFKYQYWLPAALPLFSCLAVVLPEKWTIDRKDVYKFVPQALVLLVLAGQFGLFVYAGAQNYSSHVSRAEHNDRIEFYDQAVQAVKPLAGQPLSVYYDYRLYVPDTPGWTTATNYDLLDYNFIGQNHFAVLLLLQQRIYDYLNPNVTGIDPQQFKLSQVFYRDANQGKIEGYRLVYRSALGLVYVRSDLYDQFFKK
jgi:hypothetical protein